jgi:protein-S-isoprenylcysteine O-methyltransferase Ste14
MTPEETTSTLARAPVPAISEARPAPDLPARPRTRLARALGHAPLVLAGLAVLAVGSAPLAALWCVLSRCAYVGYVGRALRAESRHATLARRALLSRRDGAEAAWLSFRDVAARLMLGDVVALGVLCLVTRGTFVPPGPAWLVLAAGALLVVLGLGVKTWAAASLDEGIFYWRDFFVPREHTQVSAAGPYRWLADPMYSLGYVHAYGFALLLGSGLGLAGAAFAQLAVLLLARLVERPHLRRRSLASGAGALRR